MSKIILVITILLSGFAYSSSILNDEALRMEAEKNHRENRSDFFKYIESGEEFLTSSTNYLNYIQANVKYNVCTKSPKAIELLDNQEHVASIKHMLKGISLNGIINSQEIDQVVLLVKMGAKSNTKFDDIEAIQRLYTVLLLKHDSLEHCKEELEVVIDSLMEYLEFVYESAKEEY